MAKEKRSFVVGVFEESTQAQQAMEERRHAGFRDDQIKFSEPGVATDSLSDDLIPLLCGLGKGRNWLAAEGRRPLGSSDERNKPVFPPGSRGDKDVMEARMLGHPGPRLSTVMEARDYP